MRANKTTSGKPTADTYFTDVARACHSWLLGHDPIYRKNFTRNSAEQKARVQNANSHKAKTLSTQES